MIFCKKEFVFKFLSDTNKSLGIWIKHPNCEISGI
jgi:hypothetical protein